MQAHIGAELLPIAEIDDGTEIHEIKDLQAKKIAELYTQTISTLSPRIVVNGRPQHLQIDRTVNWIRTLLFASLRSAVLWRQLGGGRFSLMFGRKKMLEEAQSLLPG
jgi:high frequency lysogenization protein